MMEINELEIKPVVYDVRHEQTPDLAGKESVLINYGLMLKNSGISLEKLKDHFTSANNHGLTMKPTWVMKFDTRWMNALDYFTGIITISQDKAGLPRICCYVSRSVKGRSYNDDLLDWFETLTTRTIELSVVLNQQPVIRAFGSGFDPSDLGDVELVKIMAQTCKQLKEAIERLPVFEGEITEAAYRIATLTALAGNEIGSVLLWNLDSWDIEHNQPYITSKYVTGL